MYYTSSSGLIELNISKNDAAIGSHQGDCEADVKYLIANRPKIRTQLNKIPADVLAAELKEYGAWDSEELADHEQNKVRLLWLACGDILENIQS